MPKAATRQNPAAKNSKTSSNGTGKAIETIRKDHEFTDFVEVEEAKAEFEKRRASQLESINKTDTKVLREMLYQMVLGRRFEEKCAEVYRMGKIGGFCHLYIGQEAIGVGTIMATERSDMVITAYRDHVQAMVKGMTPESVMAELYGKAGGCVGGKGGSMHMFSKTSNFTAATVSSAARSASAPEWLTPRSTRIQNRLCFVSLAKRLLTRVCFTNRSTWRSSGNSPASIFVRITNTAWALRKKGL